MKYSASDGRAFLFSTRYLPNRKEGLVPRLTSVSKKRFLKQEFAKFTERSRYFRHPSNQIVIRFPHLCYLHHVAACFHIFLACIIFIVINTCNIMVTSWFALDLNVTFENPCAPMTYIHCTALPWPMTCTFSFRKNH